MKGKIFIALSTFSQYGTEPLKELENSGFDFHTNPLGRRLVESEIIEMGGSASGIVAGVEPYNENVLSNLPELKCISRCGVGIGNIDLGYAHNRGIQIKNTPDVVIRPVVELTIAMILDLLRKITYHTNLLRSGKWQKSAGNNLQYKKVGIIGTGRIGKSISEMLIKLDAEVLAYDINPDQEWAEKNSVKLLSFQQLLRESDVISLHLSSSEGEKELLGDEEFNLMKGGVIIINTSRGYFVNEQALYNSIIDGKVAAAGLDVYSKEPYSGKLMELDNVVLTPHVATLTEESRTQMELEAVRNLINVLRA